MIEMRVKIKSREYLLKVGLLLVVFIALGLWTRARVEAMDVFKTSLIINTVGLFFNKFK